MDTPVCLDGTQDWLPMSEWSEEIRIPKPQQAGLSAQSIAYVQEVTAPRKNTPIRIFWGVFFLLSGLAQMSLTFALFDPDTMAAALLSGIFTVGWFWQGTRLMSPPRLA